MSKPRCVCLSGIFTTHCGDFVPSSVSINEGLGRMSAGKIELGVQRPGLTASVGHVYAMQLR